MNRTCAIVLAFGFAFALLPTRPPAPLEAATNARPTFAPIEHEGDVLPDVALLDQLGRTRRLSSYAGQALIVSFIYTRCADPTMCPLVTSKFIELQRRMNGRTHLLEITLDPAYDTVPVLARYGATAGADPDRWTLATADAARVASISARAGITANINSFALAHSEAAIVVAPDGRIAKIVDGNDWSVEQMLTEADATLGDRPSAVSRFELWLAAGVAAACGGGRSGMSMAAALVLFSILLASAVFIARNVFGSLFR